jgi:hypothetical protein
MARSIIASIPREAITGSAGFPVGASSASSWDSTFADIEEPIAVRRGVFGAGVVAVAFVLGASTGVTPFASQVQAPVTCYTAHAYTDRRRWSWQDARLLALAILERAEARRRALAEAEANFYAESETVDG